MNMRKDIFTTHSETDLEYYYTVRNRQKMV